MAATWKTVWETSYCYPSSAPAVVRCWIQASRDKAESADKLKILSKKPRQTIGSSWLWPLSLAHMEMVLVHTSRAVLYYVSYSAFVKEPFLHVHKCINEQYIRLFPINIQTSFTHKFLPHVLKFLHLLEIYVFINRTLHILYM